MGRWLLGVLLAEACGHPTAPLGAPSNPPPYLQPLGAQAGPLPCATSCSAMSWEVGGGCEGGVVVVMVVVVEVVGGVLTWKESHSRVSLHPPRPRLPL